MERITFKDFLSLDEGKEIKTLWSHSGIKFSRDKWKPISGKFVDKNAEDMNYEEQEEEMDDDAVSDDDDEFELDIEDRDFVVDDEDTDDDEYVYDLKSDKDIVIDDEDTDDDEYVYDLDSDEDIVIDDKDFEGDDFEPLDFGDEDTEFNDDDYTFPAPDEYSQEEEQEEYSDDDDDDDGNFNGPGLKLIDLGDDYDDRYRSKSDVPAYDRPSPKLSDFPDDDEYKMKDIDFGFGNEEQEEFDDEYSDEYDPEQEEDYDEDRFDIDAEYDDDDLADDENVSDEDPDRQGVVRHVENAHLVYKRANENNTFDELWVYKINKEGKTVRNDLMIRKHILDGTDIIENKTKSEDGSQRLEIKTIGDAQFIKITGLPN